MQRAHAYYTLVASLPALPAHFEVDRVPITWPRLESRSSMLAEDDRAILERLLDFFAWDRQPPGRTDEEVVRQYRMLTKTIPHPLVGEIIRDRFELRMLVSAVRRKLRGLGPPQTKGSLVDLLRRRWNQPQFGLQPRFPWIAELEAHLSRGDSLAAERLIFNVIWKRLSRRADDVHFTFEAVLLYVARWALVNRWVSLNAAQGRERFENILTTLLSDHVHIDI